jgi:hypothetical protein
MTDPDKYLEPIGEGRWRAKERLRVTRLTLGGAALEPVDPVDLAEGDEIRVAFTNPPRISIHKVEVVASAECYATVSVSFGRTE